MKNARNSGDKFKPINLSSLDASLQAAANNVMEVTKECNAQIREAREDFEPAYIADSRKKKKISANETLKFAYKFGRPAVLVVPLESAKSKPSRDEF